MTADTRVYLVVRTFSTGSGGRGTGLSGVVRGPLKTCEVDVLLCGPHMLQLPTSCFYEVEEVKDHGPCEACEVQS